MNKKQYTPEYEAKIVLELLREENTISEIASRENISRTQLQNWKKEFITNSAKAFTGSKAEKEARREAKREQEIRESLEKKVGQLTIEVDWLKKKSAQVLGEGWEDRSGFKR